MSWFSQAAHASLKEKRPNFAFLRRIRDHQKSREAPLGNLEEQYIAIVTNEGDAINKLVSEWADEWLEDTHGDADVEKRLEG